MWINNCHECIWLFYLYWHADLAVVEEFPSVFRDVTDVWYEMWWLRRMVEYSDHNDRFRTYSGTIWPLRHDTTSSSPSQVLADAARRCHYNVTSVGEIKFKLIVFHSDVLGPHLQGLSGCCIFRNEAAQERWSTTTLLPSNCFHPHW